ncbi:MAG: nicotinamide-nucleotide amidase [Psychrobacter glaciei]|jgi:nicotinamide-nucleotide amidase
MTHLNVQLLLTGDELMTGDIIDTNSIKVADALMPLGIVLQRKVVVGDKLTTLVNEIQTLSESADVLIINGGLGPTIDDLTAQALAEVVQQPLQIHQQAMTELAAWCERRNYPLNEPNKKQAMLPAGVDIVSNETGSAPGFRIHHNHCEIICTPGVPSELDRMLQTGIVPLLKDLTSNEYTQVQKYQVFGLGESAVQKMLEEAFPQWPEKIELGFRAAFPMLEVKLTVRSKEGVDGLAAWMKNVEATLGGHIIANGNTHLPEQLVKLLIIKNKTLALAESCTGGLIASKITSVAGSSQVFEAGIVSYSNSIKQKVLAVKSDTLLTYGAVSEKVVIEMANGIFKISGSDYAIAVSGVAGPGGGSEEKPVGTCWIAWGTQDKLKTQKLFFPGSREYFQQYIATAALDLIRRDLLEIKEAPWYFSKR